MLSPFLQTFRQAAVPRWPRLCGSAQFFAPLQATRRWCSSSLWCSCALLALGFWGYHLWLSALVRDGHVRLGAVGYKLAPLYAYFDPHWKGGLLLALAVLAAYGAFLHRMQFRRPGHEGRLVACLALWMPLIAIAVCGIDGNLGRVARPFERVDLEYFGAVGRVAHVAEFIGTYPHKALLMPMHAQTHPPGAVLFLWAGTRLFGHSPLWAAAWAIGFSAMSVPAVYLLGRELGGEPVARLGAGLYVLMPNVSMYTATSMDGPFAVFLIWSIYLGWRAVWRRAMATGAVAGIVLALATMMTFSASVVGLFLVLAAVCREVVGGDATASWRSALRTLLAMTAGGLAVYVPLYLWTGYHPAEMLGAAMRISSTLMAETGHTGWSQHWHIAAANLAVFFFCCGLAVTVLWFRWIGTAMAGKPRRGAIVAAILAFVSALVITDAMPLYTLETERIWIFLAPLVAIPAAAKWLEEKSRLGSSLQLRTLVLLLALQTVATEVFLGTYW